MSVYTPPNGHAANFVLVVYTVPGGHAANFWLAAQTLLPSGIASAQAFGTDKVNRNVKPSGLATLEAIGSHVLSVSGALQTLITSGITTAGAFGAAKFLFHLLPSGIATLQGLGSPKLNYRLAITGIASGGAIGTLIIRTFLQPTARFIGSGDVSVDDSAPSDYFHLSKFTAQFSGDINQISISSQGNTNIKIALYTDNAGESGALLNAVNTAQAIAAGWNILTFPATTIVKGTDYWLAFNSQKISEKFEYYTTGFSGSSIVDGLLWGIQTFTPSASHTITSVKLKLSHSGSPGTVTVGIRATDINGKPTGGDLCSGTTDGNTTDDTLREITFGNGYGLLASVKYVIVIRAPSGDGSNYVNWWKGAASPGYPNGQPGFSTDGGSTWNLTGGADNIFEDWGNLLSYIGFHSATAQRRYKAATFSGFTFPDPAGSGFTSANDGYYMMAGFGKSGILTAEGLGASKVNFRLNPSGITTSETIPSPRLGGHLYPSGIASAASFGTALVIKMLQLLSVTAIPTTEAFGTAFVKKMLQILSLTAVPTAEAFGTAIIRKMLQFIIPSGVASSEAFGTAKTRFYIGASGIISQEIFGVTRVNFRLRPSGIVSQQAFGVAKINRWVFPSGISSQAAFGNAKLIIFVRPSGIATLQAFGVPIVEKIILLLRPAGILSSEFFGTVIVITAIMLPPVRLKRPPRLLNALRNLPSDREDGIRRMP